MRQRPGAPRRISCCAEQEKPFREGDRVPYASRVYDEKEMCALVDSALDFWLTAGKYAARFEKATAEYEKLQKQKLRRLHQSDILETFAFEIISLPDLRIEFSDRLWLNLIDRATVYGDEKIVFKFKNGAEVEEEL